MGKKEKKKKNLYIGLIIIFLMTANKNEMGLGVNPASQPSAGKTPIAVEGEEKSLFERIKEWVIELKEKEEEIGLVETQESLELHIRGGFIEINNESVEGDYITYTVRVYENGKWKATGIFSSAVLSYEDETYELTIKQKKIEQDLYICFDFDEAQRFISELIESAKEGELQEYIFNEIASVLP